MSESLINKAQLFMRKNRRLRMIKAMKIKLQFVRVCEKIKININEIKTSNSMFITKDNEYFLILNRRYERRAYLTSHNLNDDMCEMKVISDDEKIMTFIAFLTDYSFNRDVLKIFFELIKSSLNE